MYLHTRVVQHKLGLMLGEWGWYSQYPMIKQYDFIVVIGWVIILFCVVFHTLNVSLPHDYGYARNILLFVLIILFC